MARPLNQEEKNDYVALIVRLNLIDAPGSSIKKAISNEFHRDISIPAALRLKESAKKQIQLEFKTHLGNVAIKNVAVKEQLFEAAANSNPKQLVDYLQEQINDIRNRLSNPLYIGELPQATDINARLRYIESMATLIDRLVRITGPPQLSPEDLDRKYGKTKLFEDMAEFEVVCRGEYIRQHIPPEVMDELKKQGVTV